MQAKTTTKIHFKNICVGAAHFAAIDDNGFVWSAGKCNFGQLGHNKLEEDVDAYFPRKIEGLSNISKIFGGHSALYFVTSSGELLDCGVGKLNYLAVMSIVL